MARGRRYLRGRVYREILAKPEVQARLKKGIPEPLRTQLRLELDNRGVQFMGGTGGFVSTPIPKAILTKLLRPSRGQSPVSRKTSGSSESEIGNRLECLKITSREIQMRLKTNPAVPVQRMNEENETPDYMLALTPRRSRAGTRPTVELRRAARPEAARIICWLGFGVVVILVVLVVAVVSSAGQARRKLLRPTSLSRDRRRGQSPFPGK